MEVSFNVILYPGRGAEFAIKLPIAQRYTKLRQPVCPEDCDRVMIHPY